MRCGHFLFVFCDCLNTESTASWVDVGLVVTESVWFGLAFRMEWVSCHSGMLMFDRFVGQSLSNLVRVPGCGRVVFGSWLGHFLSNLGGGSCAGSGTASCGWGTCSAMRYCAAPRIQ